MSFYIPPGIPLYLTPDSIPVGRFCRTLRVPNDPQWVGLVDGLLTTLTKPEAWREHGAMTPEETAEAWLAMMIDSWQYAECGACKRSYRITFGGMYQYSDDGGENWVDDPQPLGPPDPRTEPTDFEKRCAAAANAAHVYRLLYDQAVEYYNDNVEPALALTGLVSGVMLGLFFAPAVPFVEAIFGIAYSVLEYFTSGQFDDDIEREFKCLLIDEANVAGDGVVTFEFEDVRTLVNGKMFENPVWIALSYFLNTFGEDALNRAGATTAIVDDDCNDCGTGWCQRWDFTEEQYDWALSYSSAIGSDLGSYTVGQGFNSGSFSGFGTILGINRDFEGIHLDFFRVYYTAVCGGTSPLRRLFNDADVDLTETTCDTGSFEAFGDVSIIADTMQPYFTFDDTGAFAWRITAIEVGEYSGNKPPSVDTGFPCPE